MRRVLKTYLTLEEYNAVQAMLSKYLAICRYMGNCRLL